MYKKHMKVKIFNETCYLRLEEQINSFLVKREWATRKQLKEMKKELDKAPKIVITKKVEL